MTNKKQYLTFWGLQGFYVSERNDKPLPEMYKIGESEYFRFYGESTFLERCTLIQVTMKFNFRTFEDVYFFVAAEHFPLFCMTYLIDASSKIASVDQAESLKRIAYYMEKISDGRLH